MRKNFSQGITKALVQSKYEFDLDVLLLRNEMNLAHLNLQLS